MRHSQTGSKGGVPTSYFVMRLKFIEILEYSSRLLPVIYGIRLAGTEKYGVTHICFIMLFKILPGHKSFMQKQWWFTYILLTIHVI